MAKLCFVCEASAEAKKGTMTPSLPLNEIVDSSECENCQRQMKESRYYRAVKKQAPEIPLEVAASPTRPFDVNIDPLDQGYGA